MSFLIKGAALLAFVVPGHGQQHHIRPGCPKTFTVAMAERGARAVYASTKKVTERELLMLGRFEMCPRNPATRPFIRWYDHRQRALWEARLHPVRPAPGWAIPWPVVRCESGGHNDPPNGAGASGYYQIIQSTWLGYGGGRWASQAYLAPKYAQDIVAGRIWSQGGPSQWVCAGITGY